MKERLLNGYFKALIALLPFLPYSFVMAMLELAEERSDEQPYFFIEAIRTELYERINRR